VKVPERNFMNLAVLISALAVTFSLEEVKQAQSLQKVQSVGLKRPRPVICKSREVIAFESLKFLNRNSTGGTGAQADFFSVPRGKIRKKPNFAELCSVLAMRLFW